VNPGAYLVLQATRRARSLVGTGAIPAADWEDARQELLLDLLRRAPKFDPARGDWSGFIYGIMRNHATVLVTRIGRLAQREILTGDIEFDNGDWTHRTISTDSTRAIELMISAKRAVASLPIPLGMLALYLTHLSVVEISAQTGKSRSRIYRMIRRIRRAFVDSGLGPQSDSMVSSRCLNHLR